MGQGHFGAGPGKSGGVPGFQGQGVGAGMSGVTLVGALGRDQIHVSAENPTHRKGNGRRGGGREGPVLGAGLGAGRNRVRFHFNPEDTSRAGGVGAESSGGAPKGQGKTQRELILEAVEALKTLLGQGVGTQVVDLIQEHILPPSTVTPPGLPSELERAQHLAKLLGDKAKLDKKIRRRWKGLARPGLWWLRRDDLSILQQELKRSCQSNRLTLITGKMMLWRRFLLRRRIVVRRFGSSRRGGKKWKGGQGCVWRWLGLREAALLGFLSSYVVCRRRTRTPSSVTWDRMEVTTCPLLRVTILKLVIVLKIRPKRRVFEVFKPGKKFVRSSFLLAQGQGKVEIFKMKMHILLVPFFPGVSFQRAAGSSGPLVVWAWLFCWMRGHF